MNLSIFPFDWGGRGGRGVLEWTGVDGVDGSGLGGREWTGVDGVDEVDGVDGGGRGGRGGWGGRVWTGWTGGWGWTGVDGGGRDGRGGRGWTGVDGVDGVVVRCSMPNCSKYFSNSNAVNSLPRSPIRTSGQPWRDINPLVKAFQTFPLYLEGTRNASARPVQKSTAVKMYSFPSGDSIRGPIKSTGKTLLASRPSCVVESADCVSYRLRNGVTAVEHPYVTPSIHVLP